MTDVESTVRALAEPLVTDADIDLVDVQMKGSGPRQLLRVVVDRKGGVDLAECQQVSRRLSDRLDEVDPIPGGYALEVTSPGLDWPLVSQRDFDRVEGREVLVHRDVGEAAPRQVRGTVSAADQDGVVLRVTAARKGAAPEDVRIPYDEIVKARQSTPW